jgi:hypothetical protein
MTETESKPTEITEPETKKAKTETMVESPEQSPDEEWPEAWMMADDCEDQKALNKMEPNVPATPEMLRKIGIA